MNFFSKHFLISFNGFIALTLIGFALYFFSTPIQMGDTDMWYHLNGGRYFWDNLSIPNTSFFSFISPPREWINYFWGFQSIIFKIHEYFDYYGLLAFRALLSTTAILIAFLLIFSSKNSKSNFFLFFIFISFLIIFEGRLFQLRPHLFSYSFILAFIYILEHKPKFSPVLPILIIPWVNIHGVEWPVAAAICSAYFIKIIFHQFYFKIKLTRNEYITLISITFCALFIFINPHGLSILFAPFRLPPDTSLYIAELKPVSKDYFINFHILSFTIPEASSLFIIAFFSIFSFAYLLFKKELSISSIILFVTGCYLLTRGNRFIWEWLLLSLPMLIDGARHLQSTLKHYSLRLCFFAALFSLLTLNTLYQKSKNFLDYPLDSSKLPVGTTEYLVNTGESGRIMSPPGYNGYLEWRLFPHYLTYIDMQFPPSNDFDMYQITNAYKNKNAFIKFIQNNSPDFVLVPHNTPAKDFILNEKSFSPVFRDDIFSIYANNSSKSIFLESNSLHYIDVNNHLKLPESSVDKEKYINEYLRLINLAPSDPSIYFAISSFYLIEKNYGKSLEYADLYRQYSSNSPNAYFLIGKIQSGMENYDDALNAFEIAFENANEKSHKILNSFIGITYYLKQDFDYAYKYFNKSINPYLDNVSSETLYMYALSSLIYGDIDKADRLLKMIEYSSDSETDKDILVQTKDLKKKILNGNFDNPNFFLWLYELAISLFD